MKTLTVYGTIFLAAVMMSCTGQKTNGSRGNDSDSVVNTADTVPEDFEFEAVERLAGLQTAMPPVPLYVRSGLNDEEPIVQVVYWISVEKPSMDNDSASIESWKVQKALRENRTHYTQVIGRNDKLYGVKYVGDATSPDNEYGSLASMNHPQMGLKFKFDDPTAFAKTAEDGFMNELYWLLPDEYLNHREMLKITPIKRDEHKPLPADVVKKMEAKYGMKAERTSLTARIGDDYAAGFIQFAPKEKKCLAVEVLVCGDEVWSYSEEAQYFEQENAFSWHVDDDGEYFGNSYDAAFIGPDGIELLYMHYAPESADFGWMTIKGNKLVQHEVNGYYIWYD